MNVHKQVPRQFTLWSNSLPESVINIGVLISHRILGNQRYEVRNILLQIYVKQILFQGMTADMEPSSVAEVAGKFKIVADWPCISSKPLIKEKFYYCLLFIA